MPQTEVRVHVKDISDANRLVKYRKAVTVLAKAMGVPATIKQRDNSGAETFPFRAQEELFQRWTLYYAKILDQIYMALCGAFDLPVRTTFSKAIEDEPLVLRGVTIFDPRTGTPIKRAEWDALLRSIESYLNRRISDAARRIVLDSTTLGKIVSRLLKQNSLEAVRALPLDAMKYKSRTFSWIADDVRNMKSTFSLDERELNRIQLAREELGLNIVEASDRLLGGIQKTFIRGILERKNKGEIAQDLFDRFGGENRDWRRIVETEITDNHNNGFLAAERADAAPGTKLYFERLEVNDFRICNFCRRLRGQIALLVDAPLESEAITDPHAKIAIWEGKSNVGRKRWWAAAGAQHPNCRGSWTRTYPEQRAKLKEQGIDIQTAMDRLAENRRLWGEAQAEVDATGADVNDPGYVERINVVYQAKLAERLHKARKGGNLVPRTMLVTREGKTFPMTVWVNPNEKAHPLMQGSLFPAPEVAEQPRAVTSRILGDELKHEPLVVHEARAALELADPNIVYALERTQEHFAVRYWQADYCQYDPFTRTVKIAKGSAGYLESVLHEIGHAVHILYSRPTDPGGWKHQKNPMDAFGIKDLSKALETDYVAFNRWTDDEKRMFRFGITNYLMAAEPVSDVVDALTYGEISGPSSHSMDYYRQGDYIRALETFANLFAIDTLRRQPGPRATIYVQAWSKLLILAPQTIHAYAGILHEWALDAEYEGGAE
jgi:hypothetical protein